MTLALLLTAVTGAWAEEATITLSCGTTEKTFEKAELPWSSTADILKEVISDFKQSPGIQSITGGDGKVVKNGNANFQVTGTFSGKATVEVSYVSTSFSTTTATITVTAPAAEAPVPVTWTASTKTGTFSMPGSDVVLTPIYANAAAFATTGTGSEATTLLPEAAEGVIAGTDASLIAEGTGIVANIGETTDTQGTLMYAIGTSDNEAPALTDFNATAPTAENIADAATVYVWYYIQGADAPQGEAATLDNTFNDTEPTCLTVQVLTNKFDITFNAANANTIEAGKATVTVDGTDKTSAVTEGKLQGVKMGSEVKLEAKPGYKFRKVEVKKGAEAPAITLDNTMTAWTAGKYAVPAGGLTYSDAITVSGDVTLVLTDGETLTLNKGISLAEGATLTVESNGTMNVKGTNNSTASTVAGTGTLVLTSGTLTATGGNGETFYGYVVDAVGKDGGVAINGNVTVEGGTLTATGGNGGSVSNAADSHCGNGGAAISGALTINGGTVTTTDGSNGSNTTNSWTGNTAGTGGKAVAGTVTDNR